MSDTLADYGERERRYLDAATGAAPPHLSTPATGGTGGVPVTLPEGVRAT